MFPIFRAVLLLLPFLLGACQSQPSSPENAPANLVVTPGENRVVLTWDTVPGEIYWVYYKKGSTVSTEDHDYIARGLTSPAVITGNGLVNDTQYAFIVAASNNHSKIGPATAVVTATPRLVGSLVTWTVGTTQLSANSLNSVAFNGTHYVAVGDAATVYYAPYSYTSTGGVTAWSQAATLPIGVGTNLSAVIYDGSQFVAMGSDGSIIISSDAVNWTARTAISSAPTMHALVYVSGFGYLAVGDGGAIYKNTSGGVTDVWSVVSSGSGQNLYGIAYLNGRFVAVGANGTLLTSTDGSTWAAPTGGSGISNSLRSVAYGVMSDGKGRYVAVGDAGAVVSSADAVTWTPQTPLPTTESFYSICFGPARQFIAVGTTGAITYSSTGVDGSWTTVNPTSLDLHSIVPNSVFIAVGAAGTNVSGK